MNHHALKQRFDHVEELMAMLITLGRINTPKYKELDHEYELLKALLSKPAMVVETCECGHIRERMVPATKAPKIYDSFNQSVQFMVYEIHHKTCQCCREKEAC